jgi:transposase
MAKMGRPTVFDAEKAKIIIDVVRAGNYIETAANFAGVSVSTVRAWITSGARGESEELADFSAAIYKADSEAEIRDIQTIGEASKTQWQAAAWRRERRAPQRWGRRDQVELNGTMDLNHVALTKLSPEEFQAAQDAFVIRNAERIERLKKEAEERLMLEAPEEKESE